MKKSMCHECYYAQKLYVGRMSCIIINVFDLALWIPIDDQLGTSLFVCINGSVQKIIKHGPLDDVIPEFYLRSDEHPSS